jgi:hypothetical protein
MRVSYPHAPDRAEHPPVRRVWWTGVLCDLLLPANAPIRVMPPHEQGRTLAETKERR